MFLPIICWDFIKLREIINALVAAGFRGLRIFFNLRDLPYIKKPNQGYIQYCFDTMPNGMHTFTYEGSPSPDVPKDMMRDPFLLCKKLNWFPMVCIGTSEEPGTNNWIGRVPLINQYEWLGQFAQELGLYLRYNMGFERADCEIWNEFTKCMVPNQYCDVSIPITNGWDNSQAGKVWVFSDDIFRQDKLDVVLARRDLMTRPGIAGITTHAGVGEEDMEFDNNFIAKTTNKLKTLYSNLNQFVSEITFNGRWERKYQLVGTSGYGLIGAVRTLVNGNLLGTRMDDIWLIKDGKFWECSSPVKAEDLKIFNENNLMHPGKEGSMILKFDYKLGSKGMGVKFVQKVCNKSLTLAKQLGIDGGFGPLTETAVKNLNANYGFTTNQGIIDWTRFKFYLGLYPDVWNECEASWDKGER